MDKTAAGKLGVNTSKVTDRRKIRFATVPDLLADADRLIAAENAGTLRKSGNWTLGQALAHLAAWVDFAYDGYPIQPPWFVRIAVRPFKRKFIRGGLPAGQRIPRIEGGTLATEPVDTDEANTRFRRSWDRLVKVAPTIPNPIFGPMSHDEWIQGHLRHAELHLSFFHEH